MKYILALSLLFLGACKDNERESQLPESCKGEADRDGIRGFWNTTIDHGRNSFYTHKLRLKIDRDMEVGVSYSCSGNGAQSQIVKVNVDYDHEEDERFLNFDYTGDMRPTGNAIRCVEYEFGGKFEYERTGKCLRLIGLGNNRRYILQRGL